jgi:hypothetical protein
MGVAGKSTVANGASCLPEVSFVAQNGRPGKAEPFVPLSKTLASGVRGHFQAGILPTEQSGLKSARRGWGSGPVFCLWRYARFPVWQDHIAVFPGNVASFRCGALGSALEIRWGIFFGEKAGRSCR